MRQGGCALQKAKFRGKSGQVSGIMFIGFRGAEGCVSFWFCFGARLSRAPFFYIIPVIPGSAYLIPD
jgi:hypothetical protein